MDDKKLIGYKNGMAVFVSDELLAQEGDSHEDAVQRYLSRTSASLVVTVQKGMQR